LSAKWLHGAIAKNLNANVEVTVTQSPTSFKKFPNYHFDDPTKKYESQQQLLFNGKLNAQGEVRFNSRIESGNSAPGFLKASFITRVFEEGGDFSVDRFSTTYSTYRSYAGLSTPSTNIYRPVIETGKIHEFGLASVSENGEAASSDLQVKIFRLNWEWWWDSFDDDVHYYLSRPGVYPVYDSTFSTKNGKADYEIWIRR
jgi:alpha-2-macroglobulin